MRKKVSLLLAIVLICSCLFGCSGSSSNSSGQQDNVPSEDPVKLSAIQLLNPVAKNPSEMPYIQQICADANVEVDWTIYAQENWLEQKNVILASNDLPDLFMGKAIGASDFAAYSSFFVPLDDLIEEHAPNIKRMYDENDELKIFATELDGHIYGLTTRKGLRPDTWRKWCINTTWLENLGLSVPSTFDELYDVLKAFKEEDANGNGDPNDEFPMTIFYWMDLNITAIVGAYGNYAEGMQLIACKDGQFAFIPEQEDFRSLFTFMNKLYADGLLHPECVTMDYATWTSIARDPDNATCGASIVFAPNEWVGPQWEDQYEIIPQIAAEPGIDPVSSYLPYYTLTYDSHVAQITTKCENPEAAIRFLDLFYTEDNSVQGWFGSFGVGVEKDSDGNYKVIVPNEYDDDEWKRVNSLCDNGLYYISEAIEEQIIPTAVNAKFLEDEEAKIKDSQIKPEDGNAYYLTKLTVEETNETAIILTDLKNIVSVAMAEWTVNGVTDDSWNQYLQQLKTAGVDRYLEIYQKAYDTQVKNR